MLFCLFSVFICQCCFSFLLFVGIKGVTSCDALAKCYDRPPIHKSLLQTFLPMQIWAKKKKKKKKKRSSGLLVKKENRLLSFWFDAFSPSTHAHSHIRRNTHTPVPPSPPKLVTGISVESRLAEEVLCVYVLVSWTEGG